MNESPVPESVNEVYPNLFNPMGMAGRELKNRIVHASITTSFPRDDRHISEKHFRYFVNRARGGAAMAITEPLGIAPHQPAIRVRVWDAHLEDELKRWAAAVEGEGCRFLGQIMDSGRGRHVPGRNPTAIGASAQPDDLSWTVPHVLTADEIKRFVDHAAASALRLCRCGFSGVEISSGHGQLFHQFLSPWSNTREDGYGGDLEGRARLLVEVCTAIRQSCGDGFILGVKLPGNDGVPGGVNPAMAADIARHLVGRVKVDYLCYAQGSHHRSLEMHIPDDSTPRLTYMGMIAELRKATPGVPVMALGRITDPAEAEGILVRGDSDLVALGRSLIVDPMWPNKAQAGHARDIRYCVSCNTCWRTAVNTVIVCDNNPRLATPEEVAIETPRVAVPRRIVIVGAGIAGLEAACAAAERGHSVTVLGSSPQAGGKARLQASLPSSESLSSVYDYQWITANKAGVRFALGETATVDSVLAHRPDAVVLATGATMIWPRCLPPELKNDGLVRDLRESIPDVLALKACQPGAAVIYDMDHMEGTYAAVELLHRFFDEVVILTPRERIAEDVPLVTRQRILRRFGEMGIRVHVLVEPLWTDSFENEGRLDFKSIYGNTVQSVDNVAFFSYSTPRAPNDALLNPLRKAGLEVHLIGDCKAARAVQDATAEGYAIGRAL